MAVEGVVIKTEDDCMLPSCAQSTVKREPESDWEAADVKLESEMIISDCEDESSSQESASKQSSPSSTDGRNMTMVAGKTLKIILKRCDADSVCTKSPEQRDTSSIKREDCHDASVVSIKAENAFEAVETAESETCTPGADVSNKAAVSCGKQSDFYIQANTPVQIKKEKGLITHELVGYSSKSPGNGGVLKHEVKELQPDFFLYSATDGTIEEIVGTVSEISQPKNKILGKSPQVKIGRVSVGTVKKETCNANEDDVIKTAVEESSGNCLPINQQVLTEVKEEGKVQITNELVSNLPRQFKASERDDKALLKIVKREKSEIGVRSKLQSYLEHPSCSGVVPASVDEKSPQFKIGLVSMNTVKKETCNADDVIKTAVEEPLGKCMHPNQHGLAEEEEEKITSELVSPLPEQFKGKKRDEKPVLKIVKREETEAGVGSDPQSDHEHQSVSRAVYVERNKTVPVLFQPKSKVLPNIHRKNNSSKKRYSCSECSYRSQYKTNLTKHIRVHTGERPYECKECSKKFKTNYQLSRHKITHTNKRLFKCAQCAARFKSKTYLIKHLIRHTNERPYSCTLCPAKFKFRNNLTAHLVRHSSERRFECAHCSHRFKKKVELKMHLILHCGDKFYSCTLCPVKFQRRSNLNSHLRAKHTSGRPFECTQCGARFKSGGNFKRHSDIHSDVKPFQCPHCPATFRRNSHLKRHFVAIHTSEELYACAHCSMKFKQKREVSQHLITHSNKEPYLCPQCPMTFKHKSNLKVHLRRHTGEKPYSCPQCPANFSQQGSLMSHLMVHSDEWPFSCDECPAKFKSNGALKRHRRTHVADTL